MSEITKHLRVVLATAIVVYVLPGASAAGEGTLRASPNKTVSLSSKRPSAIRQSGPSRRQGSPLTLVDNIVNTDAYEGCGCYFQLPHERRARSRRYFLIADQSKRAWMNIAGEDIELHLIGATHMSLKSRKGQRSFFRFGAAGVEVRVAMLVTRTSTYEADYEPARYAVTVQAFKGKHTQTVRTTGACGC